MDDRPNLRVETSTSLFGFLCLSGLLKYNKFPAGVIVSNEGWGFHFLERRSQLRRNFASVHPCILPWGRRPPASTIINERLSFGEPSSLLFLRSESRTHKVLPQKGIMAIEKDHSSPSDVDMIPSGLSWEGDWGNSPRLRRPPPSSFGRHSYGV